MKTENEQLISKLIDTFYGKDYGEYEGEERDLQLLFPGIDREVLLTFEPLITLFELYEHRFVNQGGNDYCTIGITTIKAGVMLFQQYETILTEIIIRETLKYKPEYAYRSPGGKLSRSAYILRRQYQCYFESVLPATRWLFQYLLELSEQLPEYFENRAQLFFYLGEAYTLGEPDFEQGYFHLNEYLTKKGEDLTEQNFYLRWCWLNRSAYDPCPVQGYTLLGKLMEKAGDLKEAEQFYLKAIALNPLYHLAPHKELAELYMSQNQLIMALPFFENGCYNQERLIAYQRSLRAEWSWGRDYDWDQKRLCVIVQSIYLKLATHYSHARGLQSRGYHYLKKAITIDPYNLKKETDRLIELLESDPDRPYNTIQTIMLEIAAIRFDDPHEGFYESKDGVRFQALLPIYHRLLETVPRTNRWHTRALNIVKKGLKLTSDDEKLHNQHMELIATYQKDWWQLEVLAKKYLWYHPENSVAKQYLKLARENKGKVF